MYSVGIAGFRGYSGAELVRILEAHPGVRPVLLEHKSDSVQPVRPKKFAGPPVVPCTPQSVRSEGLDAVMLCTPHEVSMALAPEMLEAGAKVIDLSGAFRFRDPDVYARWYGHAHTCPELLSRAAYGLPEFYRDQVRGASLVANPGCYPTAANLAIRPLVQSGVVDRSAGIVCDAKSGVSGAGRKPSLKTSFCEVTGNFSAYSLLDHRHVPEVLENSHLDEAEFSFTAHLLPIHRGILETIYFATDGLASAEELVALYERAYEGECFVRVYNPGEVPDLRAVNGTNFCDIGVKFIPGSRRAVVVSAIDNLVKGAAGQAVQNLNLILGLSEQEGLL